MSLESGGLLQMCDISHTTGQPSVPGSSESTVTAGQGWV